MISGLILAAGTSSRLGSPKQLLDLGGRTVLQRSVDSAAAAGMDEVVVVLGHEAERILSALELPSFGRAVVNPDYATGQASSLRVGLRAIDARSEAAAVFLGDQPSSAPEIAGAVVDAWRASAAPVARAVYRGTPGHPVVIGRAAFPAFESARGDDGGRSTLQELEVVGLDFDMAAPFDIDTWEQYEAVCRAFS